MARLRVVSGPLAGQTIDVENEVVIGREDTDLTIDDVELSRRHAVVRRHASRLQVEDLGSTNGTYVDGIRIEEPTILGGGAEIQLGTTKLVVEGVLPAGAGAEGETPQARASQATRASIEIPPEMQKQPAAAGAAAAATGGAAAAAPPTAVAPPKRSEPLAPFNPPEKRQPQRGLASRSWLPVALSYGSVIVTAIALVLYFALRSARGVWSAVRGRADRSLCRTARAAAARTARAAAAVTRGRADAAGRTKLPAGSEIRLATSATRSR